MDNCEKNKLSLLLSLNDDGLVYQDTKDPELLKKFLEVRKCIYSLKEVTSKSLSTDEGWDYGLDTRVIVVTDGDKCVGGAVFVINRCRRDQLLPLESEEFKLAEKFPEFELHKNYYAAFKSVVLLPEYANWKSSINIFKFVIRLGLEQGVKFVFSASAAASAKRHIMALKRIGCGLDLKRLDVKLPNEVRWNGYERLLHVADSRELYKLYKEEKSCFDVSEETFAM